MLVEALLGTENAKALDILWINADGTVMNSINATAPPECSQRIIDNFADLFKGVGSFNSDEVDIKIDPEVMQQYRPIH